MTSEGPIISAVIPILGDYVRVHDVVESLICDLSTQCVPARESIEFVFVLYGDSWLRSHAFFGVAASGAKIVTVREDEELPAVLFNRGALAAHGKFLSFAWPGVAARPWLSYLDWMCSHLSTTPATSFHACLPPASNTAREPQPRLRSGELTAIPPGYATGWLEMIDYVPIVSALVSREMFLSSGGFSCSPLLQRGFWWEFTVRASRIDPIRVLDAACPPVLWTCADFPLANDLPMSGDLIARRVVRRSALRQPIKLSSDWADVAAFAVDLPKPCRHRLGRLLLEWSPELGGRIAMDAHDEPPPKKKTLPIRIVVLGGLNEPAHNQLCFFNYFHLLEGQGKLTWRVILDTSAHPVDLAKADLVIFSRVKSESGCRLMDYCCAHAIPTVYMLDDNWFSVGRDWPEYADLFSPGGELYERFLYCVARADCVLTYNAVLAEDLRPHCRRLQELRTNIDLSLFPQIRRPDQRPPRVGYVGSPRNEESAFLALAELAKERDDFDVFLMSAHIPDALHDLPPARLIHHPYVYGYHRYAHLLCEHTPDILLAPLGTTRTDASKCPNKYLEITAAGAAGIYSDTAPYNNVVIHGQNGLLVANNVASWKSAIEQLLDDSARRSNIVANAVGDVHLNFNTPCLLASFMEFLTQAAGIDAA